ncbi:hypothetical protein ILUMI_13796, partial [Ignelater luminosus]
MQGADRTASCLVPAACGSSPLSAPLPTSTVNLIAVPLVTSYRLCYLYNNNLRQEIQKRPFQAYGVYFDGRKDKTLIQITEGEG